MVWNGRLLWFNYFQPEGKISNIFSFSFQCFCRKDQFVKNFSIATTSPAFPFQTFRLENQKRDSFTEEEHLANTILGRERCQGGSNWPATNVTKHPLVQEIWGRCQGVSSWPVIVESNNVTVYPLLQGECVHDTRFQERCQGCPTGQCKERPLMASLLNLNQRHRTNSKTSLKNYYKTSLNNCIIKKIAFVVKTNAIIWQKETALQQRLFKFYNDFVEFHMLCGFSDFCSYIGWVDLLTFMALQRKRIGLGEKVAARPSVNHSQQQ